MSGLSLGHLRTWCSRPHRAHLGFGQCKYKNCYKFDVIIFICPFYAPGTPNQSVISKVGSLLVLKRKEMQNQKSFELTE